MESKWRQNVADLGLIGSPTVLIARVLDTDPIRLVSRDRFEFFDEIVEWILPDVDDLPFQTFHTVAAPGDRFPFGFDVEPDVF